MGDGSPKQKERFSRACVVAAAAAADFTYEIVTDDEHGVDMIVRGPLQSIDIQLKATSNPTVEDGCLIHDLDMRTYNLLRSPDRGAYSALVLVVVGPDTASWQAMDDSETRLAQCAYYLPLLGMAATTNTVSTRLKIPMSNQLTADAMKALMSKGAARWSS